jgi:hypothetical protein
MELFKDCVSKSKIMLHWLHFMSACAGWMDVCLTIQHLTDIVYILRLPFSVPAILKSISLI